MEMSYWASKDAPVPPVCVPIAVNMALSCAARGRTLEYILMHGQNCKYKRDVMKLFKYGLLIDIKEVTQPFSKWWPILRIGHH